MPSIDQFSQLANSNALRIVLDKPQTPGQDAELRKSGHGLGGRLKAEVMSAFAKVNNARLNAKEWMAGTSGDKRVGDHEFGRGTQATQDKAVGEAFQKALTDKYGDMVARLALRKADIRSSGEGNVSHFKPLSSFKIKEAINFAEKMGTLAKGDLGAAADIWIGELIKARPVSSMETFENPSKPGDMLPSSGMKNLSTAEQAEFLSILKDEVVKGMHTEVDGWTKNVSDEQAEMSKLKGELTALEAAVTPADAQTTVDAQRKVDAAETTLKTAKANQTAARDATTKTSIELKNCESNLETTKDELAAKIKSGGTPEEIASIQTELDEYQAAFDKADSANKAAKSAQNKAVDDFDKARTGLTTAKAALAQTTPERLKNVKQSIANCQDRLDKAQTKLDTTPFAAANTYLQTAMDRMADRRAEVSGLNTAFESALAGLKPGVSNDPKALNQALEFGKTMGISGDGLANHMKETLKEYDTSSLQTLASLTVDDLQGFDSSAGKVSRLAQMELDARAKSATPTNS